MAIGQRRQRHVLGLPIGKRKRPPFPVAKVAGAALATAAAVPASRYAGRALGRGRRMVNQAEDVLGTANDFKTAVSSHSSTIGKVGAVISEARKLGGKQGGKGTKAKLSHLIEQHTDIAAPRSVVYNQWTQFEMFPRLVKGVESVRQEEDDKMTWTSKIGPSRRNWEGHIVEQIPDERIAWKSEGGAQHQGVVTFHQLDEDLTRVLVQMEYKPKGPVEVVGNTLRIQRRRVKRDLRLFKHFIELRGEETGAWRGHIDKEEGLTPKLAGQQSRDKGERGASGSRNQAQRDTPRRGERAASRTTKRSSSRSGRSSGESAGNTSQASRRSSSSPGRAANAGSSSRRRSPSAQTTRRAS